MTQLSVFLLGPPGIMLNGERTTQLRSAPARALLLYLAAEATPPEGHARERLMTLLWPEIDTDSAQLSLRQTLFRLRKAFEDQGSGDPREQVPLLLADRHSVQLNPAIMLYSDLAEFRQLRNQVQTHDHPNPGGCPQCLAALEQMGRLYRGEFLEGFSLPDSDPFEEWLGNQRTYWQLQALSVLDQLSATYMARQELAKAEAVACRQLAIDRYHEPGVRQLMQCLALSGRRPQALAYFQQWREMLMAELQVEPAAETEELAGGIRSERLPPSHLPAAAAPGAAAVQTLGDGSAPLPAPDTCPRGLPFWATRFVGREAELARIGDLLADPQCRLISLVGLGGSGKTRLAVQAATLSEPYAHCVCFVGLETISTPEGLVDTLAQALGMTFYVRPGSALSLSGARSQIVKYLTDKRLLLILDNFEQLVGAAAFVTDLLASAPQVKVVVTSRERLNVPGEWVLEVGGLAFPGIENGKDLAAYSAVQLFVDGARRGGAWTAAADDWPAIVRICRCLGGMPLAVEMAAAWTRVLSCQEIAAELEHDLFSLAASWCTMPERHRTLRIVCDHSWQLLRDDERAAFCRLAVFRNDFRREAAAEIAGVSLFLLRALIDKSLVSHSDEGRYDIHPLLREYAAGKLAADPTAHDQVHARHAHYYCTWLVRMDEQLKGSGQMAALQLFHREMQNLHEAWKWMIRQKDLAGLHSVLATMILFHEMHGRPVGAQQVMERLQEMLAMLGYAPGVAVRELDPATDPVAAGVLALVLAGIYHFSQIDGPVPGMDMYVAQGLAVAQGVPDSRQKAYTLLLLCMGREGFLVPERSIATGQHCVQILVGLDDVWGAALAHLIVADVANLAGVDEGLAYSSYKASLDGFGHLGDCWGQALCFNGLAILEHRAGRLEEAYRLGRLSLNTFVRMGDSWRAMQAHGFLGEIAEKLGRTDAARDHYAANLDHFARLGNQAQLAEYHARLSRLGRATPMRNTEVDGATVRK